MDAIYSLMGVCPQHDLLWETLTGREHLTFYGRLKGLVGAYGAGALGGNALALGSHCSQPPRPPTPPRMFCAHVVP
jgi:hypothetical protein